MIVLGSVRVLGLDYWATGPTYPTYIVPLEVAGPHITKSNPVKYLLIACHDIKCIRPFAIKGQAVANLLANFLGTSDFSLPQQEVLVTEEQEWSMHFDGLSTS